MDSPWLRGHRLPLLSQYFLLSWKIKGCALSFMFKCLSKATLRCWGSLCQTQLWDQLPFVFIAVFVPLTKSLICLTVKRCMCVDGEFLPESDLTQSKNNIPQITEWWTEEKWITALGATWRAALASGLPVNSSHGQVIYLKAIIRWCTITKAPAYNKKKNTAWNEITNRSDELST